MQNILSGMKSSMKGWLYRYGPVGGLATLLIVGVGLLLPWWVAIPTEEGNFQIYENDEAVVTVRWGTTDQFSSDLAVLREALKERGKFAPAGDFSLGKQTFKKKAQVRILSGAERLKDYRQRLYTYEVVETFTTEKVTRFFVDAEEAITYILQDREWRRPERDIQRVPHPYPPYHQFLPKTFGTET